MKKTLTNISASVRARLLNLAREQGRPYNEILQYYAMERLLHRLSISRFKDLFILKGALMLHFWGGPSARPTRDIDLSARGNPSIDSQMEIIGECLRLELPEDGLRFDLESLVGNEILIASKYNGVRLSCDAYLGNARLVVKIDIGFGDVVKPEPVRIVYPSMLDFAKPQLWGYTAESLIAEKFHAMVIRDLNNTRLKDFYDVWSLAHHREFAGMALAGAIEATFQRRGTKNPMDLPIAFTKEFSENPIKQAQWAAFLRKGRLEGNLALSEITTVLRGFLMPPIEALADRITFSQNWPPGGPWQSSSLPNDSVGQAT